MTDKKPSVTMFTDASVLPLVKSSGWACWIKGDGRDSASFHGKLRSYHPDSTVAELEAIANGLLTAADFGYFRPEDSLIMIQTDSVHALACLRKIRPDIEIRNHAEAATIITRRKKLHPRLQAPVDVIVDALDNLKLNAVVRHVRGHKEGRGRQWVNRHCDQLAKEAARANP